MALKSEQNDTGFHGVGLELDQSFRQWWSVARQSEEPPTPFDFLVNLGLEPAMARDMLWEAMADCCPPEIIDKYSDDYDSEEEEDIEFTYRGPGAIDYLVHQLFDGMAVEDSPAEPPIYRSYAKMLEASLRYGPGPDKPTEQDIRSLALLTKKASKGDCDLGPAAVRKCLRYNFSAELLHFLIDRLPFGSKFITWYGSYRYMNGGRPFEYEAGLQTRSYLDHDCMLGIQKIFSKVKKVELAESHWTKHNFPECLRHLLQTSKLEDVTLGVPHRWVVDASTDPADFSSSNQEQSTLPLLSSQMAANSNCGIKSFKIYFEYKDNADLDELPFPGACMALESIFHMPNLQHLDITLGLWPLENALPYLQRAIQTTQLRRMMIHNTAAPSSESLVLTLLEALKHNSTIVKFHYRESGYLYLSGKRPNYTNLYEKKLLEVLREHNSTLTNVELCVGQPDEDITYYLDLNRYGRQFARNPQTPMKTFVSQLTSSLAEEHELLADDQHGTRRAALQRNPPSFWTGSMTGSRKRDHSALDVGYGLLRELPGLWSTHACHASKRPKKCSEEQEEICL